MIADELSFRIRQAMGFPPTAEQSAAIAEFCRFLGDRNDRVAMILRGSAGTGKTTLAGAMVRALASLGQKMLLLAPTGRAAKVFSLNANHPAFTIHRKIYRQKVLSADMGGFSLADNLHADTLFIVDEASMIANQGYGEHAFGSGCLLDDLVQYVYSGRNCRMMVIGDQAQLPPVGEDESPALSTAMMEGYGLAIYEANLSEVLRQSTESGILYNATRIRQMDDYALPKIATKGFPDVRVVPGDELIETLAGSYSRVGLDDTIVVSRSNKRANVYNQGIRNQILGREEELTTGDMLMIVKNNYYWTDVSEEVRGQRSEVRGMITPSGANNHQSNSNHTSELNTLNSELSTRHSELKPSFLANGDICRVQRVRNVRRLYGFRFADITLLFPDYDDYELTCTVLLDSLTSDAPSLTREQHEQLFNAVMEDYADYPRKADRIRKIKQDIYYNALQVKFAYAVTCHKAQGGQWSDVYIDQGYMTDEMLSPDYIHWLYTAFTRATERVFLVNWPKTQIENAEE